MFSCFSICRMHILAPFLLDGAWYLGRNHLICYFDFSPSWRPVIFSKFFHVCVCTHTNTKVLFYFVVSEYSSFPKDFYHICTAIKGQNPSSSPPNGYLRPGSWDMVATVISPGLEWNASICFAASYESAQGQHLEATLMVLNFKTFPGLSLNKDCL